MTELSRKIAELQKEKTPTKVTWKRDVIYTQLLTLEANSCNKELPKKFYLLHVAMPEENLNDLLKNKIGLDVEKTEMVSTGHTYGDAYLVILK